MWGGARCVPTADRPRRQAGLEKQACLSSHGKCAFPVSWAAGQKAASRALSAGALVRQVMEGRRGQGGRPATSETEALELGLLGPRRHVQRNHTETGGICAPGTRPRASGDREPCPGATFPTGSRGDTPPEAGHEPQPSPPRGAERGRGGRRRPEATQHEPPPSPACSGGTCRVNPSCQPEVLKFCPASSPTAWISVSGSGHLFWQLKAGWQGLCSVRTQPRCGF